MRTLIMTALLATTTVSYAASLQEANALLNRGYWQNAGTMAAGLGTSEGYAVAAKATTLGASISPAGVKRSMLEKAQGYANQAIKLDANNANAYFELSRADGRLAQFTGILQSLGLAGEVKRSLNKAIELNPKLDGAYVGLGLWNAELISKGFIATRAAGANRDDVIPNLEKAIALAPTAIAHRIEYSNALLDLDRNGNKAAAIAQLQKAVSFAPVTYWDKVDLLTAKKKLSDLSK
jgi:tetratricopeptide (TPR) repeat protein